MSEGSFFLRVHASGVGLRRSDFSPGGRTCTQATRTVRRGGRTTRGRRRREGAAHSLRQRPQSPCSTSCGSDPVYVQTPSEKTSKPNAELAGACRGKRGTPGSSWLPCSCQEKTLVDQVSEKSRTPACHLRRLAGALTFVLGGRRHSTVTRGCDFLSGWQMCVWSGAIILWRTFGGCGGGRNREAGSSSTLRAVS